MNENILVVQNGDETVEYMIERIIRFDNKFFFTIFNLSNMDFMFGEYVGKLPDNDDEALKIVCEDFKSGCKHIAYPDGYIVDDLYEMIDLY